MGSGLIDTFLSQMSNGAHDKAMVALGEVSRLGLDVKQHLAQRKQELDEKECALREKMGHATKHMQELQRQINGHRDSIGGLLRVREESLEQQQQCEVQRSRAESESEEAESMRQKAVRRRLTNTFVLLIPVIGMFAYIITESVQKNAKTIRKSLEKRAESSRRQEETQRLLQRGKRTQSECEEDIERLTSEMQRCRENLNDIHGTISDTKQQLKFIHLGLSACREVALYTQHASEQTTNITEDIEAVSAQSTSIMATSGAFTCTVHHFKMAWQKVCNKSQENLEYLGELPSALGNHILSATTTNLIENDQSLDDDNTGLDATTKIGMAVTNITFLLCLAYCFGPLSSYVVSWILVNIWFELFYMLLSPPLIISKFCIDACLDVFTPILENLFETFVNSRLGKPLVFSCKAVGIVVYIICYTLSLCYRFVGIVVYIICYTLSLCYRFVGIYYTLQLLWVGTAMVYLCGRRIQTQIL